MRDLRDKIYGLRWQADCLPYSPTKVALLEQAVSLADTLNDRELGYDLRGELIAAASFSGRADLMLTHFAWRLACYDANPAKFDGHDVLWQYKWIVTNVVGFAEISRAQIEALLEDMACRYRACGSTLHAVYTCRRRVAQCMGERKLAQQMHRQVKRRARDELSDCPACQASEEAGYYAFCNQPKKAVEAAAPVLQGRLRCVEEPHVALHRVLLPLLKLGRLSEAWHYQARGYRLVAGKQQFLEQHAQQLKFAALAGDLDLARRIFQRHLPCALAAPLELDRYAFYVAACLWLRRLREAGTHQFKLRIPDGIPPPDTAGKYHVAELQSWFTQQAERLALRFDLRNGNDFYQRELANLDGLLSFSQPLKGRTDAI
ncbi:MAG: hypothetical protein K6T86_00100 [Pirellulales bacterium]|nr:hypothetical protein [Pirellulales bacterium]